MTDAADIIWSQAELTDDWMHFCIVYDAVPPKWYVGFLNWLLRRKHNPLILYIDGK
jgi:hypothetical protein